MPARIVEDDAGSRRQHRRPSLVDARVVNSPGFDEELLVVCFRGTTQTIKSWLKCVVGKEGGGGMGGVGGPLVEWGTLTWVVV